jgi:hypothetical protein
MPQQARGLQYWHGISVASHAGAAPGCVEGKRMKRSRIVIFSLVLLLAVLTLPAFARADVVPDGWTWDAAPVSVDPSPEGWTWDEAAVGDPAPEGWTWDEAVAPVNG